MPASGDRTVDDLERVEQLLGRPPAGAFDVVVRDESGDPVVIRNAPLLKDGRPMPTRYWLVGELAREEGLEEVRVELDEAAHGRLLHVHLGRLVLSVLRELLRIDRVSL